MSRPPMDAVLAPVGPAGPGNRTVLLYVGAGADRHMHHQIHALTEAQAEELVARINAPRPWPPRRPWRRPWGSQTPQ